MPNAIVQTITDIINSSDPHVKKSVFEFDEETQKIKYTGDDLDDPLFAYTIRSCLIEVVRPFGLTTHTAPLYMLREGLRIRTNLTEYQIKFVIAKFADAQRQYEQRRSQSSRESIKSRFQG